MAEAPPPRLPEAPPGGPNACDRFTRWVQSKPIKSVLRAMSVSNILNGVLLGMLYPLGFAEDEIDMEVDTLWLAGYTVFFSLLLIVFELHIPAVDRAVRRYFGFLFNYTGRVAYVVFIGTLAISSGWALGYVIAVFTLINSCFNCYLLYSHPAFREGGEMAAKGYMDESWGGEPYAEPNPQLSGAAASAGIGAPAPADDPFAGTSVASLPTSGAYHPPIASSPPPQPTTAATSAPASRGGVPDDNPFSTGVSL